MTLLPTHLIGRHLAADLPGLERFEAIHIQKFREAALCLMH